MTAEIQSATENNEIDRARTIGGALYPTTGCLHPILCIRYQIVDAVQQQDERNPDQQESEERVRQPAEREVSPGPEVGLNRLLHGCGGKETRESLVLIDPEKRQREISSLSKFSLQPP